MPDSDKSYPRDNATTEHQLTNQMKMFLVNLGKRVVAVGYLIEIRNKQMNVCISTE